MDISITKPLEKKSKYKNFERQKTFIQVFDIQIHRYNLMHLISLHEEIQSRHMKILTAKCVI